MITKKMYRYLGRNGTITTHIQLENIAPIEMVSLEARQGKILTDGVKKVYAIIVFADEIDNWHEIDDDGQD
jgi:hypothetical protein